MKERYQLLGNRHIRRVPSERKINERINSWQLGNDFSASAAAKA